ncbi:hypothetical protein HNO89_004015 [Sporosarcina luteola]|nr:hypothetical protein [Sporosarcina luteola]
MFRKRSYIAWRARICSGSARKLLRELIYAWEALVYCPESSYMFGSARKLLGELIYAPEALVYCPESSYMFLERS